MAELSRNILLQPCQVKRNYRYSLLLLSHSLKEYWKIKPYCPFFSRELSYTYLVRTGNCSGNIIGWLAGLNSGIQNIDKIRMFERKSWLVEIIQIFISINFIDIFY